MCVCVRAGLWLYLPPSFTSPAMISCETSWDTVWVTRAATSLLLLGLSPDVSPLKHNHICPNCNKLIGSWLPDLRVCFVVGAVTVISPLELVRTKMQSRQLSYSELRVCIRSAVAQDGLLSLWRGLGPTVLRDVPFSGESSTISLWYINTVSTNKSEI